MATKTRYRLIPQRSRPGPLTGKDIAALSRTTDYLVVALTLAKQAAELIRWDVLVHDRNLNMTTHIVNPQGNVETLHTGTIYTTALAK
jgi:hypothetical protein